MPLYNVDLKENMCWDYRSVTWEGVSLDEFIADVKLAAEGLTDPSIDVEADTHYEDFAHHTIFVCGKRVLTKAERDNIIHEREKQKRFRDHMATFKG